MHELDGDTEPELGQLDAEDSDREMHEPSIGLAERRWLKWDFFTSLLEAIGMAINH
jgi:hypothetical protein